MTHTPTLYAGIMTGTSLDAADAVLCEGESLTPIAHARATIPSDVADTLRRMDESQTELSEVMDMANAVTRVCAKACESLPRSPEVIGCHGQTLLHRPERGWSLQLINGALLAELTGADVVCDFRSRDIAAGGQGAPLAPLFHHAFFGDENPRAVINLGGIANISVLERDTVRGWDICPANMLLDAWHHQHCGGAYDKDGSWAGGGEVIPGLLKELRAHPFLSLSPPKSCGREQFDLRHFQAKFTPHPPQDVQATLLEWSASVIAETVNAADVKEVFLCGGGVRNTCLLSKITAQTDIPVRLSDEVGITAEHVEAAAFAWLAREFVARRPINTAPVTGATGAHILGALYPAGNDRPPAS